MPVYPPTYRKRIYYKFKNIDANEHRLMIRFYQEHEKVIFQLEDEQYFELLVCYLRALFEVGSYDTFLKSVDEAIEFSLQFEFCEFEDRDVFQYLLFRKAAAHYHMMEYGKAVSILEQLVQINPEERLFARFLRKCMRRQHPTIIEHSRAFSVFLFLAAAIMIAVEILFVRNFYPDLAPSLEFSRNLIFGLGLLTLFLGDGLLRLKVYRKVLKLTYKYKRIKTRKNTNSIKDEANRP
jgi:tetratricopeptide (TPR) repeat protein